MALLITFLETVRALPTPALWSIIASLFFIWAAVAAQFVRAERRAIAATNLAEKMLAELNAARCMVADLLKDNELANKECEQNRAVIEIAKEERLHLLKQQAEDGNALSELRTLRIRSAETIADLGSKIDELSKDIDARSRVMIQQVALIEKYRTLNEALMSHAQTRGENGRFAKRASA